MKPEPCTGCQERARRVGLLVGFAGGAFVALVAIAVITGRTSHRHTDRVVDIGADG